MEPITSVHPTHFISPEHSEHHEYRIPTLEEDSRELEARLAELVFKPPAQDKFASDSAKAMLSYIKEDPRIYELFHLARYKRMENNDTLTSITGAYMLINHIPNFWYMWIEEECDYPYSRNLDSEEKWLEEYRRIFQDELSIKVWEYLLNNYEPQTNFSNRGVAFPWFFKLIYGDQQFRVADKGCSAGYVMKRVAAGSSAQETDPYILDDETSYKGVKGIVATAMNSDVKVSTVGVDLADPLADPIRAKFFTSCRRIKDMSKEQMEAMIEKMKRFQAMDSFEFREGNMLHADVLEEQFYDTVIFTTTLYQLGKEDRQIALEQAEKELKENGLIIVCDYTEKNEDNTSLNWLKTRGEFEYRMNVYSPKQKRVVPIIAV